MRLTLKNIAKVKSANVEVKGITVIAGENNTGKSTIGKSLYGVFNSLYHVEKQIRNERVRTIENLMQRLELQIKRGYIGYDGLEHHRIAERIVDSYYEQDNKDEFIRNFVVDLLWKKEPPEKAIIEGKEINDFISTTKDVLEVSDEAILKKVITDKLNAEFNKQVNNIYSVTQGNITLHIRDEQVKITVSENSVEEIQNPIGLQTKAVYLDDPFVLDEAGKANQYLGLFGSFRSSTDVSHRSDVIENLAFSSKKNTTIDEILINRKLKRIYEKIDSVCDGQMISVKRDVLGYQKKNSDKILDVKNISTGLKTFVILKTLLLNGSLEQNGTIILDEPEIHLHPQWQLLFAELIVLIQKEFDMHILLNTHSPYFLQAIEVYAAKYEIADRCKYYLARLEGEMAVIDDVSNSTETIYKLLARPFQDLENTRYGDD